MYNSLTRQITRRLSQNLRHPLAVATPLGRQLLEGLRSLSTREATGTAPALVTAQSPDLAESAAASAANLAGWGRRNPRAPRGLAGSPERVLPLRTIGAAASPASSLAAVAVAPAERRAGAAASAPLPRPAARAARCTVDPIDARRAVISGRMSDVCDALDRLIALQAAQSAQGTRFAI
jgi:hypothetical protein